MVPVEKIVNFNDRDGYECPLMQMSGGRNFTKRFPDVHVRSCDCAAARKDLENACVAIEAINHNTYELVCIVRVRLRD